jgi:endonuclease G, mitochondrial
MRRHHLLISLVLIVGFALLRHHGHSLASAAAPYTGTPATWSSPESGGATMDLGACARDLPNGQAPQFNNAKIAPQLHILCYQGFVAAHFAPTRTPLWSAEYLDPARIEAARQQRRVNSFHADPNLPYDERAELSDYVRSGYDRGHLSPSGDQPSPQAQAESFTLANIAPQNPGLNRGPWEELETSVRELALQRPLYVITGLRYIGADVDFLRGRVGIPSTYYKLVYDPATHSAAVFEAPNRQGGQPQAYAVAEFEQMSGIHFGLGSVNMLSLPSAPRSRFVHGEGD